MSAKALGAHARLEGEQDALLAAFNDRFAIGIVIGVIQVPVILVGCVGGSVIGGVIHGWGLRA